MSKKIIIAAFLMLLAGNASAQWFDTLETIPGRYKKYYYPEWYDECPIYYTDSARFHTSYMQIGYGDFAFNTDIVVHAGTFPLAFFILSVHSNSGLAHPL